MLSRPILVVALAALLLTGAASIVLAQAPASPTPTVLGTPAGSAATPTATPTALGKLANNAGTIDDAVTKIMTAILKVIGGILLTCLLCAVLIRFISLLRRPPQLVIAPFDNATGDGDVDKAANGISQLSRERLLSALDDVSAWVGGYLRDLLGGTPPDLEQFPPPSGVTDTSIATLVSAIKDSVPAQIKPAVQLLSVVFQEKGTRVNATLQRRIPVPDTPGQLGISFVVADIRGQGTPTLRTIWESPVAQSTSPAAAVNGQGRAERVMPAPQVGARGGIAAPPIAASVLYEIGTLLAGIFLFEDAATYLGQALGADPAFGDAATDLAACVAALQVQQGGVAAYAQGQKMQDAGLAEPAIANYLLPLALTPPAEVAAAEVAWRVVLKVAPGDEGRAYLRLARAYYRAPALLFDQPLALFKQAAAHGSAEARSALGDVQRGRAAGLTQAGLLLLDLGRFVAAEKYAMAALAAVPDDPHALALLASVKRSKPASEDTDATALYTLGQLYESAGASARAQTQYEESLKKQPTNVDAQAALARIIASQRTVTDRAVALLDPAARWLALHLLERGMRTTGPRAFLRRQDQGDTARVANFFGYFYQASAEDFPSARSFFFEQAIAAFQRAIEGGDTWYLPHLNLAETYVLIGEYAEARAAYDRAKQRVPPGDDAPGTVRRICIGMARALLGEGREAEAQRQIDEAERGWNPATEKSVQTLYNLASCDAIKQPLGSKDAQRAREYLVYALARAGPGDWLDRAATDPDLDAIRDAAGLESLTDQMIATLGPLRTGMAPDAAAVDAIVTHTGWTATERSGADGGS